MTSVSSRLVSRIKDKRFLSCIKHSRNEYISDLLPQTPGRVLSLGLSGFTGKFIVDVHISNFSIDLLFHQIKTNQTVQETMVSCAILYMQVLAVPSSFHWSWLIISPKTVTFPTSSMISCAEDLQTPLSWMNFVVMT